jgi:hypothetical protein
MPVRWGKCAIRVVVAAALAAATLATIGVATVVGAPAAAATTAPALAYLENFEHGVGVAPVSLTDYIGADQETFTADPCPGDVLEFNAPVVATGITAGTTSAAPGLGSESAARWNRATATSPAARVLVQHAPAFLRRVAANPQPAA